MNVNTRSFQSIADSAQTEYCTTFHFPSVCPFVTGVTSHISHIYKGINAMLIIRGPIKPCIFWIKITLTFFLTRPDQTRPSAQTWPTWPLILTWNYQNINAISALFTWSCCVFYLPVISNHKKRENINISRYTNWILDGWMATFVKDQYLLYFEIMSTVLWSCWPNTSYHTNRCTRKMERGQW